MNIEQIIKDRTKNIIVARHTELEIFKNQFNSVLNGNMEMTFITGSPGIGKTYFVEHAVGMFQDENVTYVYGKFRQYDQNSFVAISEIIEQIIRHLLTLPHRSLQSLKNELIKKIGNDIAIIVSICPYAKELFGSYKNIKNFTQLKYRVRKSVNKFMEIVSKALFPLIMFIDDLQWIDKPSASIIEAIAKNPALFNLHLVLAFRNAGDDKLPIKLTKRSRTLSTIIRLQELSFEDVEKYIDPIFGDNIQNKGYLTRIIYSLTLGNPFYVNRMIRLLCSENVLKYSPDKKQWLVVFSEINNINLPSDIEQIVVNQIVKLTREDQKLLELIACFGGYIEYEILKDLSNKRDLELLNQLNRLCSNSILLKSQWDNRLKADLNFKFAHDIVYKLIFKNISNEEKSLNHFHIAMLLVDSKYQEFVENNKPFVASNLLKTDWNLLIKQDNIRTWIDQLYSAGIQAKQTAAIGQALIILKYCANLIKYCHEDEKSSLEMQIYLEMGECNFIHERVEDAKQIFNTLVEKYPDPDSYIEVNRKYINLYACNGNFEKVMEIGTEMLAHLGLKLNTKELLGDLLKSRRLFSDKNISKIVNAPIITDKSKLHILETLTVMAPSANRINNKVSAMVAMKLAVLAAEYGSSAYSPVAYSAYCYFLYHILGNHQKGKKLENIVLELLDNPTKSSAVSITFCILGAFINHWTNPLQNTLGCLERSIEEGKKEGEALYSSYAVTFAIITQYVMGRPLKEIQHYINRYRKDQQRLEHYLTRYIYDIYERHIHFLEKGKEIKVNFSIKDNEYRELFANTLNLNSDMLRLQRLYLQGEIQRAFNLAEEIDPRVKAHKGFVMNVDFVFYSILIRTAIHKSLITGKKSINKRIIKSYLKKLKSWVDLYKGNHYAKYLLAKAEYAVVKKNNQVARLYHEAIDFAEKQENLPLAAIANLLTAKYYSYNKKLSGFYGREAIELFDKWGAGFISSLVAQQMELSTSLAISDTPAIQNNDRDNISSVSILNHLEMMKKMSEDESYAYLLNYLCENDHVKYSAVFFDNLGEMFIKYDQHSGDSFNVYQDLINMNHLSEFPHSIVRYAARTGEQIFLDKTQNQGIFAKSLRQIKDEKLPLACIPLKYLGTVIGIIYLEKINSKDGGKDFLSLINCFTPTLLTKKAKIKRVNIKNILKPESENYLFTDRELEVLKLIAEGLSNAEISQKLFITVGTVRNHISTIYIKLEVDNRIKAVLKAKSLNIITL